jgi:hypothetical protein
LITDLSGPTFFVIMAGIMLAAVACFGCIKTPEPKKKESANASESFDKEAETN